MKQHFKFANCRQCGSRFTRRAPNHQYCDEECVRLAIKEQARTRYLRERETTIARVLKSYYANKP